MRDRDKRASGRAAYKRNIAKVKPGSPSRDVERAIIASGPASLNSRLARIKAQNPFTPEPSNRSGKVALKPVAADAGLLPALQATMSAFAERHNLTPIQLVVLASEWRSLVLKAPAMVDPLPDETRSAELPTAAPELWSKRDLNQRETPPAFTRRVYADSLGNGLTRKHLKTLDPDLYRALAVWLNRHPDDEIAQSIPKQGINLDDLIEKLSAEYSLDELRRLGYAINSRLRRQATKINS